MKDKEEIEEFVWSEWCLLRGMHIALSLSIIAAYIIVVLQLS